MLMTRPIYMCASRSLGCQKGYKGWAIDYLRNRSIPKLLP